MEPRHRSFSLLIMLLLKLTMDIFPIECFAEPIIQPKYPDQEKYQNMNNFDGMWSDAQNIVLITQFDEYIIVQGKSSQYTWSASCIVLENEAHCAGNGIRHDKTHFLYESLLKKKNDALHENWKAVFAKETIQKEYEYAAIHPKKSHDLFGLLEGRQYYLFKDSVTCKAFAPGAPRIKSWANRLEFSRGKVLIWQTICNDNPLVRDFDAQEFTFAKDLSTLTYQSEKYTYSEQVPKLCDQGYWCPAEEGSPPQEAIDSKNQKKTGSEGAK